MDLPMGDWFYNPTYRDITTLIITGTGRGPCVRFSTVAYFNVRRTEKLFQDSFRKQLKNAGSHRKKEQGS